MKCESPKKHWAVFQAKTTYLQIKYVQILSNLKRPALSVKSEEMVTL